MVTGRWKSSEQLPALLFGLKLPKKEDMGTWKHIWNRVITEFWRDKLAQQVKDGSHAGTVCSWNQNTKDKDKILQAVRRRTGNRIWHSSIPEKDFLFYLRLCFRKYLRWFLSFYSYPLCSNAFKYLEPRILRFSLFFFRERKCTCERLGGGRS